MKKTWDEALRSLARRPQGSFRVLAYGVTGTPEEIPSRVDETRRVLISHGFSPSSRITIEVAPPGSGAASRPKFRAEVLEGIEQSEPVREEAETPGMEARDHLRSVSAGLAQLLGSLDSDPLARPPASPMPMTRGGRGSEEMAIVVVDRFEDLGADAEAIGSAIQEILLRGAHLLLSSDGIDTRTKEGRGRAAVGLRLAGLRASGARERSLRELEERRRGLEVYGPVPFGFERVGRKLVPVAGGLEAVGRARELAGRGVSRFEIALALNREGRSWKDGSPWTGRRVELVLRNPIYDRARREEIA